MKAFPTEHPLIGTMNTFADGMDLRDYFAAKAMQAILSWEDVVDIDVSKEAYMMADAMMEARSQ